MRRIIKNREIIGDNWVRANQGSAPTDGVDQLVPLAVFLADPSAWIESEGRLGVELSPTDEPETLAPYLATDAAQIDLVAINFPKFTDGRGYTTAHRVRTRLGWKGELRATGDVLPDQVFYMHRCGFNAFEVRADKRLETALRALSTFSVTYQGAQDGPPLYRRRFSGRRLAASGQ